MQTTKEPPTITQPRATRTHRLWRIVASTVQIIVITVLFALLIGMALLFVLLPALLPQR